jgi:hypothetical protein
VKAHRSLSQVSQRCKSNDFYPVRAAALQGYRKAIVRLSVSALCGDPEHQIRCIVGSTRAESYLPLGLTVICLSRTVSDY